MTKQKIILEPESGSYEVQEEVRKLLSFRSQDDWSVCLQENGKRHHMYYHYTTLSTLKAILTSSHWRLKLASKSNDFHECKIHNASFTTGSLSSIGMWNLYSSLKEKNDIGVRIGIPMDIFHQIFTEGNIWEKKTDGSWEKIKSDCSVVATDVAYWHFGSKEDGSKDRIFYKGYSFPFHALGIYDKESREKIASNSIKVKTFERPDPKEKLLPCFKRAVWRSEAETRVYCDFRIEEKKKNKKKCPIEKIPDNIPDEVYAEITPEQFRQMEFRLSPKGSSEEMFSVPENRNQLMDLLLFFGVELLGGHKINFNQFHLPSEQEDWQDE